MTFLPCLIPSLIFRGRLSNLVSSNSYRHAALVRAWDAETRDRSIYRRSL